MLRGPPAKIDIFFYFIFWKRGYIPSYPTKIFLSMSYVYCLYRAQFLGVCKYQIQLELKYRVNKLRYVYSYVQMFPMISSTPPYHFLPRGHRPLPMATAIVARGRWWYCSQHASWRERLWNGNKPGRIQGWYVYCYVQMFPIISSTPSYHFLPKGPCPLHLTAAIVARERWW